jgi:hypothetical protein
VNVLNIIAFVSVPRVILFLFGPRLDRFLLFLRTHSGHSQVREKIKALRARNAELCSTIAILSDAASALRLGRGQVASALISDSGAGVALAVATAVSGGGVTLASVTRSLVHVRRLLERFERRWGLVRDRTLGATLKVCVCVCVCVCGCVSGYVAHYHSLSSTSSVF